ncbi:hypothetical protein [Corallococcus macrosporus]|uniref:Uncharacterized protein n=1 Tax=Corallococcus macrosporus DSM 14697 TaxID=1189310 RepID=A0A286NW19_9BACT|nr:hypothetical protein [Corallococcus macrosporus]ATB51364.1 hypothetical protein MYMAC_007022 [Corallococcus macrosporus DSM 14697]
MHEPRLSELRAELSATHYDARIRRMVELGRLAPTSPEVREVLGALSRGDAQERQLALFAQYGWRDGGRVLSATTDASNCVRSLAYLLVPLACDDAQALEALKVARAVRRQEGLLRGLVRAERRGVIDAYLDGLATSADVPDFADAVPLATPEGIRRHLPRALARPSLRFWNRLAHDAPGILAEVLAAQLQAVTGEPDPVTRMSLRVYLPRIADQAPDAALALFELLLSRRIHPDANAWHDLVLHRPEAAVALLQRHPHAPVFEKQFARAASRLSERALLWLVRRAPITLGDARTLLTRLSESSRRAVVEAWCAAVDVAPDWGAPLLRFVADTQERERVYARWSVAARNAEGVIPLATLTALPFDLREREARRHLQEVVALGTRPLQRMEYARLLSWDEADAALKSYLGHPEGNVRGEALASLLAIPGLRPDEPSLVDRALPLVLARKNEQDPVRAAMLGALVLWPRRVWRREHTESVGRILRDALDAADLSYRSAELAEALLLRTFARAPEWGATWLSTLLKERGQLFNTRLGEFLTDDEVRAAAPQLLGIARGWAQRERGGPLLALMNSLGARVRLVPGLPELAVSLRDETPWSGLALGMAQWQSQHDRAGFESTVGAMVRRFHDRGWLSEIIALANSEEAARPLHPELISGLERVALRLGKESHSALTVLRSRAWRAFDALLPRLLKADASVICFPVVHTYLHRHRQELLTPYLSAPVVQGHFATGKTGWLLAFDTRGFYRWTSEQCALYSSAVGRLVADPDRDTPTLLWGVATLAALTWAPMDGLCALADDARPVVRDKAIQVMARCDQGQGVPTLLNCLEDARARVAIYGLRRAFSGMPPGRVLSLLAGVPLTKVTVAKEVVRLLGELRVEAAYERLLALDGMRLHRDVRIAMLRALWDHLEREPTWAVYARAVDDTDWVMAARLGDVPADRLTEASDRKLSALLGRVLARPEPEARIDLLQRAAWLAVRDVERTFLSACGARLASPYDDEVRAAMQALLYRSNEQDLERMEGMLDAVVPDRRALTVALEQLLALDVKSRASYMLAARAAEQVLSRDSRVSPLRVRCAAAALAPLELAERLAHMGEAGHLHADALEACQSVVGALPVGDLEAVEARLTVSGSAEARRVAVWCLVRDAAPGRGWTPERLARLVRLQQDASPLVSGAAQAVFPPREQVSSANVPSA